MGYGGWGKQDLQNFCMSEHQMILGSIFSLSLSLTLHPIGPHALSAILNCETGSCPLFGEVSGPFPPGPLTGSEVWALGFIGM